MSTTALTYYGAKAGAAITLDSQAQEWKDPVLSNEPNTTTPWAHWGSSGDGPKEWITLMRKCGVLLAAIEGKARIAMGKGIKPVFVKEIAADGTEVLEYASDTDIAYWMEANQTFKNGIQNMRNILGFGWTHIRVILDNSGTKIARFKADDVSKCRLGRKNKNTGQIEHTYYSPNFDNGSFTTDKENKYVKKIPLLQEGEELEHLQKLIEAKTDIREFSIIYRGPLDGQEYYPYPMWYGAKQWVEMAGKIPGMKVAQMNNEISLKFIVDISSKYFELMHPTWHSFSAEQQKEAFEQKAKEIDDKLSGSDNAYKSIVSQTFYDTVSNKEIPCIKITPINDLMKEGKGLVDSSAGNKEILFSLMINPAILGANTFGGMDGGAGSGSDIREAYLVQIMLMEAERQMNTHIYNMVKHVNGWAEKYTGKNLQFRYPNSVLTTLDTGGSLKPVN